MPTPLLRWNAVGVQDMLARNGIHDRGALAKVTGLSRSTIFLHFAANWEGVATLLVLTALTCTFDVSIDLLVTRPAREEWFRLVGLPTQKLAG